MPYAYINPNCDCDTPACDGVDCDAHRFATTGLCGANPHLHDCHGCAECECSCRSCPETGYPLPPTRRGRCTACRIVADRDAQDAHESACADW